MSKIRVYELAKMLGISNKDLLTMLEDLGIEAKTHMSSIDNDVAQLIEEAIHDKKTQQPPIAERLSLIHI